MFQSIELIPADQLPQVRARLEELPYWEPIGSGRAPSELIKVQITKAMRKERLPLMSVVPNPNGSIITLDSKWVKMDGDDVTCLTEGVFRGLQNAVGRAALSICWMPISEPEHKELDRDKLGPVLISFIVSIPNKVNKQIYLDDSEVEFNEGDLLLSGSCANEHVCPREAYEASYLSFVEALKGAGFREIPASYQRFNEYGNPVAFSMPGVKLDNVLEGLSRVLASTKKQKEMVLVKLSMEGSNGNYGAPGFEVMDQYLEALWPMDLPWDKLKLEFMVDTGIFVNPDWDIGASIFGRWVPIYIPLGGFDDEGRWTVDAEGKDGKFRIRLQDKYSSDLLPPSVSSLGLTFKYEKEGTKKKSKK